MLRADYDFEKARMIEGLTQLHHEVRLEVNYLF